MPDATFAIAAAQLGIAIPAQAAQVATETAPPQQSASNSAPDPPQLQEATASVSAAGSERTDYLPKAEFGEMARRFRKFGKKALVQPIRKQLDREIGWRR